MTRREKTFRHIEDNGNAMRYTDIIKFAYEDKYGIGKFDKKHNRGHYSGAFAYYSKWTALFDTRKIGEPKGHFVKPTKNGQLVKLSNGLWSVHRPLGWTRESGNCQSYEVRIEKFLSDGKSYTEREIVSHLKPYVVERNKRKIGYDFGNTNNLLHKMIAKGKLGREMALNTNTGRFAYHYYSIDSKHKREIDFLDKIIDKKNNETKKETNTMVENKYIVINIYKGKDCDTCDGIFGESELKRFFISRDPKNYRVYEVGNEVTIQKQITTTVEIK